MKTRLPIDYHLDDIDIFNGEGVELPLLGNAARGEVVSIGQLSAFDWFYTYHPALSRLIEVYDKSFGLVFLWGMATPDDRKTYGQEIVNAMTRNRLAMWYLAGVLKRCGVFSGSRRKFLKRVLVGQLAEIFILLYAFNTDGLKKKLHSLLELVTETGNSSSAILSDNSTLPDGYQRVKMVREIKPFTKTS